MRRSLPLAALLGVAFLLGCQDLGSGPAVQFFNLPPGAILANGIGVSMNPEGTQGVIERHDDGSNTLYQYDIPGDIFDGGVAPEVGGFTQFMLDPELTTHATQVGLCPGGKVRPCQG